MRRKHVRATIVQYFRPVLVLFPIGGARGESVKAKFSYHGKCGRYSVVDRLPHYIYVLLLYRDSIWAPLLYSVSIKTGCTLVLPRPLGLCTTWRTLLLYHGLWLHWSPVPRITVAFPFATV